MSLRNWRAQFTIQRIYPEALQGLIELVERYVPKSDRMRGPYSVFLELMRDNLEDWQRRQKSRGHLVGMGMGSIYDIGGPYDHFPGGEAGFARFDDTLKWLHRLSYRCAESWLARGPKWSKADDTALLEALGRPEVWLDFRRCRGCGRVLGSEQDLARAAQALGAELRLRLLLERGGPRCVRALMKPEPAPLRRPLARALIRLRGFCEGEGVRLVPDDDALYPCPDCGVDTVGTPRALSDEQVARLRPLI